MCTVFEATRAKDKAEGRIEGITENIIMMGSEFGLSKSDIISRLQGQLNISLQKAKEYLDLFGKKSS